MLVVHAWLEQGSAKPLRATIRHTADASAGFTNRTTVTDVDAAVALVRRWLEEVVADPG